MRDYFKKNERVMSEKEITDLDVWNIDEIGYQIGCGKAKLVVIMDPNKPLRIIDPENCDYITSVECIGSAGETISPMFLFSGVNILHKWRTNNNLDSENLIGTTGTGHANDNTALDWLQDFMIIYKTRHRVHGFFLSSMVMVLI